MECRKQFQGVMQLQNSTLVYHPLLFLMWLYQLLAPKTAMMTYWTGESSTSTVDKSRCSNAQYLRPIDQLLAALMRNKLGLFVQDVADRFGISPSTFSNYYTT